MRKLLLLAASVAVLTMGMPTSSAATGDIVSDINGTATVTPTYAAPGVAHDYTCFDFGAAAGTIITGTFKDVAANGTYVGATTVGNVIKSCGTQNIAGTRELVPDGVANNTTIENSGGGGSSTFSGGPDINGKCVRGKFPDVAAPAYKRVGNVVTGTLKDVEFTVANAVAGVCPAAPATFSTKTDADIDVTATPNAVPLPPGSTSTVVGTVKS